MTHGIRLFSSLLLVARRGRQIIHLNHAGASPSPKSVVDRMIQHFQDEQIVGGYAAEDEVGDEIQRIHERTANLIGSTRQESIAMVQSATDGWTRLFYSFCEYQTTRYPKQSKVILISEADYAANVVAAARFAAQSEDWTLLAIPSSLDDEGHSTGKVDLGVLEKILDGSYEYGGKVLDPSQIKLVCVTHIPTNSGIVNPVEKIGQMISEKSSPDEMLYLVDACQSVGQRLIDVSKICCHGLVATGRKYLRAPRGTGLLYVSDSICDELWPHHVDHYSVPVTEVPDRLFVDVPVEEQLLFYPRPGASKFTFWESNVAGILGFGKAIEHLQGIGQKEIQSTISGDLGPYLQNKVNGMDRVQPYHKSESGIFTFLVKDMSSESVVKEISHSQSGEEVRPVFTLSLVPATSTPLDSARTKIPNLVRASFSYTTTHDELDQFCRRLESL